MRRLIGVLTSTSLALVATPAGALAMQPPGESAQHRFGCVDGESAAVAGHPGAAGLLDATPRVGALTDDPLPTAWNAVEHAEPIDFGGC